MTTELILGGIGLPILAWTLTTLLQLKTAMTEIRTTLIGVDGQNGIRSDVRAIKADVERHEHRLTLLEHPGTR